MKKLIRKIFLSNIFFVFVFSFIALADQEPCGQFKPEWTACKSDEDCVAHQQACYSMGGFNKYYLEEIEKYNTCIRPMIRCVSPSEANKQKTAAICRNNICKEVRPGTKYLSFQESNNNATESLRIPTKWLKCVDNSSCTVIRGVCGSWVAVNKINEELATTKVRHTQAATSCEILDLPKPTEVICREELCDYDF